MHTDKLKYKKFTHLIIKRNFLTWLAVSLMLAFFWGGMGYIYYSGVKMITKFSPLADAAVHIKLEASYAHLWFEEIISGDKRESIDTVWQHIDQAKSYAQTMLDGGNTKSGTVVTLEYPEARAQIVNVLKELSLFRAVAEQRLNNPMDSQVGSISDQKLDAAFQNLINEADAVEILLRQAIAEELNRYKKTALFVGILSTLLIMAFVSIFGYMRRQEQDTTERKRVEQLLKDSETYLRAIFDAAPDAMLVSDKQGIITMANQQAERLLGYPINELLGLSIEALVPERFRMAHPALRAQYAVSAEVRPMGTGRKIIALLKDGRELPVEISLSSIQIEPDLFFVSTLQDITERKRIELDLRIAATAFDTQEPMVITDAENVILRINKAFTESTGYTEQEVVGQRISMLKSGRHDAAFYAEMWESLLSVGAWQGEIWDRRKNGEIYPKWLVITAVKGSDGVVTHYVGIHADITGRKLAEEALLQAKRNAETVSLAKSEFLANMSHEIRTPMNAILGMAEILSETELTPEQRRYVGIFQDAGNNLLELINDILDMSKVEAGQLELDKEDFSLEQALNGLMDLHAIRAFDKGLELVLDIKPGVPEFAHGDAKRLRQCLTNLVGNAIKFSHEGGLVICVRPVDGQPDMLQFSVSDTGIGIPTEKQETIFEAFSQADSSTTRQFGGTGLGLTITRRLVGLMEGKIWVDSREGEGSTFYFTACLPPASQPLRTDIPVDLRNLNVLVVDDFPINRIIVRQYLQPLGAEVSEAESAKQALVLLENAAVKGVPFALALVDSQMPEMCGLDLIVQIRANPALEKLKILILSSDDTTQQRQRAKDLALTCLLKPIKRHELIQSIGRELQQNTPTAPNAETSPSALPVSYGGLNILLAEDNPHNVLLIEVFLKQTTHRLDVAEDGSVALEKFSANRYDVVLMDVNMPKMDGYEATAEIRRIEAAEGRTPTMIIALTANALKEDEQRSIDAGCNGHLTKPIKKKVLLEVLQSIPQFKSSMTEQFGDQ